jgi:hypothetical protein
MARCRIAVPAFGLALVPGGGVDVPVRRSAFSIRVQADHFSEYSRGDYGRHYWGHLRRASTGIVFQPSR